MTNKIDQLVQSANPPRVSRDAAGSPDADKAAGNRSTAADSVRITGDAARLAAVESALGAAQDFDAGKVEALRDAIAAGRYEVDAAAVADKMVAFEQTLGRGR